jgi:aerobic carbon-monoxide dehydrogenase large subunit
MNTATRFGSGKEVLRVEDDELLKGLGKFTDDMAPQNQARLCFLRSPYPHARIISIDTKAAKAMPGVLAIYTGAELVAAGVKPIPGGAGFARGDGSPAATPLRRALAHERVRYVGEAFAMIIATSIEQARNAAEAIETHFEELPAAVTIEDATATGATALCAEAPDNICAEMRHGNAKATDEAFAKAAHQVKLTIHNQRVAALSIEPRSVLA